MRLNEMRCVKRVGHGWMAMDWWGVRFKMVIDFPKAVSYITHLCPICRNQHAMTSHIYLKMV